MTNIFNSWKLIFLLSTVFLLLVHTESKTLGKIDPNLLKKYEVRPKLNIFVRFTQGTSEVLKSVTQSRFPDREGLLNALNKALKENARESQLMVVSHLSQITNNPYQFTSLWISNELYIRDADLDLILSLLKYPAILFIYEEEFASLVSPISENPTFLRHGSLQTEEAEDEWGIQIIQAKEAIDHLQASLKTPWNQIRVATIDTGVRVTHEALRDNFLGEYGWFDPYDLTALPNDNHGHGTHTTGTIAGKYGIGVFPNATWMACKGCASATCNQFALMECGQFITCPTLPNRSENNCALAPHIVSNSWYYILQGFPWYNGVIAAWQTAGIIPLFSIGNEGPKCKTANSPGDQTGVIGVGSTTIDDKVSSFSSLGPAVEGWLKPDITAPGSSVISAHHTADNAYKSMSGTSMACPHAAGLIAILLTYDPELNFDKVKQYIFDGVDTETLNFTGKACGSDEDDRLFPNNIYGHGRINAFKSIKKLVRDSRRK